MTKVYKYCGVRDPNSPRICDKPVGHESLDNSPEASVHEDSTMPMGSTIRTGVNQAIAEREGDVLMWKYSPARKFSNDLSDAQAERLAIAMEEMGEAIQIMGKILRHGYHSWNPEIVHTGTNRDDLAKELGDVQYAINLMMDAGDFDSGSYSKRRLDKEIKIKKYLHHQPDLRDSL